MNGKAQSSTLTKHLAVAAFLVAVVTIAAALLHFLAPVQ